MKNFAPLLFIAVVCVMQSPAQQLANGNFQSLCDTSATGLCSWNLSWGGKGACSPASDDDGQYLRIRGKNETSVGFTEQPVTLKLNKGVHLIHLSGKIKADSIIGKGAGLNIGIYDSAGMYLTTKDMGYAASSWVKGNTEWKTFELTVVCPENTALVKVGAILYGKGDASFDDFEFKVENVAGRKGNALAQSYITAACDSIARHSLVKDALDMQQLKTTALEIAGEAKTPADCYPAVEYLLSSLRNYGDYHSFLMRKEEVESWANDTSDNANIEYATSRMIDGYGYIYVPHFNGGNKKLMVAFADTIQAAIHQLSHAGIKGWIVDLRMNTGGNMEPMITGLGPLFSDEILGSLVDVNGEIQSWHYINGTYGWDSDTTMSATHPLKLSKQLPIAVLTSNQTGSSGEIVAISFIGNKNTRSFGQPTWGLTTGNGSFDLPDGARMMLASTRMADRNGKVYEGSIPPDEPVDDGDFSKGDNSLSRAIEWIKKQ